MEKYLHIYVEKYEINKLLTKYIKLMDQIK